MYFSNQNISYLFLFVKKVFSEIFLLVTSVLRLKLATEIEVEIDNLLKKLP